MVKILMKNNKMFNFIKKIFTKKEPEKETVKLDNLNGWFDAKSDVIHNNLNENINLIKNKINSEIEKTKLNLERLKEAKLQNPNIPIRAKQMMEGNRASYIKIVSNFLNNIKIENNYKVLLNFCNDFDDSLNTLGKSTTKSYHVLKEFLEHQVTDVAINIKNIDNLIKEIKSTIENSSIGKIEIVKNKIIYVKNKIKQKTNLKEELKNKEAELGKLKQEKESLLKEIENIKNSEAYLNFNNLKKEKELILGKINNNKDIIFQSFSILNRALRKFSRIILEDEKLLNDYIENPVNTLLKDKELKIIKILESIEKNLVQNKIKLDEKKKNKTLTEIRKLDKQFFINFLNNYNELDKKLKIIEDKIENNEIRNKYRALNEKLNQINTNLERTERNIENLKKDIEKIDIEKMKSNLQEEINKIIKTDISIS
jgi:hypothetical protein